MAARRKPKTPENQGELDLSAKPAKFDIGDRVYFLDLPGEIVARRWQKDEDPDFSCWQYKSTAEPTMYYREPFFTKRKD